MKRLILALALLSLLPGVVLSQTGPWIITTDYSLFGRVRSFDPNSPWTVSPDKATIPGDAVGRHHQGLIYIVGRGGSNLIQVYDPSAGFSLVREFSVGAGRNPQDIAFAPDGSAYVSCYDAAVLLRMDTTTGVILNTFSTATYADADGLPETAWLHVQDGLLYITCQLLDRGGWYAPVGPGKLLVFDLAARAWLQPIQLVGSDPYCPIRPFLGEDGQTLLAVGCVGFYTLMDGGIEAVDPATGQSLGYLATEADLGADVINFVFTGPESIHALLSDSAFATSIVHLDLSTGNQVITDASSGYNHADLAWDGDRQLFVADRTPGAAGIRVFDSLTDQERTTATLATGLPPFLFIMPESGVPAPVPVLPSAGISVGRPYPNPCNPTARVLVTGPPAADLTVWVCDLRGRRVSGSTVRTDAAGRATFVFSGMDDSGAALAAGVYRIVAHHGSSSVTRSLVLVK